MANQKSNGILIDDRANRAFDLLPGGLAMLDRTQTIVYSNRSFRQLFGLSARMDNGAGPHRLPYEAVIGPAAAETGTLGRRLQELLDGERERAELELKVDTHGRQRWLAITMIPYRQNGTSGVLVEHHDISAYRQAAAKQSEAAERPARILELVHRISTALSNRLDEQEILSVAADELVDLFWADHTGIVLFDEEGSSGTVVAESPQTGALGVRFSMHDNPIMQELLTSQRPVHIESVAGDPRTAAAREELLNLNIQSLMVVPLIGRKQVIGSIGLDSIGQARIFSREEQNLFLTLAHIIAGAIEVARLYQQLQLEFAERERAQAALGIAEQRQRELIEGASDLIYLQDLAGTLISINRAGERLTGYRRDEVIGKSFATLIAPEDLPRVREAFSPSQQAEHSYKSVTFEILCKDGRRLPVEVNMRVLYENGRPAAIQGIARDISERRRAEEERARLQEEVIRMQQALLAELSTPLLPLSADVLAIPLIGTIDPHRAQRVLDALLEGVSRQRARIVIVDITGVPVIDTQVANALIRAAQAVRLLGAQVVLTGIRAEVAQMLVGMGVGMEGIVTRSSLQDGIAYALTPRR